MADVDDAHTRGGESSDDLEELRPLRRREPCRGLVHDQVPHIPRQGTDDLGQLLLRHSEVPDEGVVAEADAEPGRLFGRAPPEVAVGDEPTAPRFPPEGEVVCDVKVGDEGEILVDDRDAGT